MEIKSFIRVVRKNGKSAYFTLPRVITEGLNINFNDEIEITILKIIKRDKQEVRE